MKKVLFSVFAIALMVSFNSCTKCYVCTDKDSDSFTKIEYCDKDFDKGDIDAIIEAEEDAGATCHAKSRLF